MDPETKFGDEIKNNRGIIRYWWIFLFFIILVILGLSFFWLVFPADVYQNYEDFVGFVKKEDVNWVAKPSPQEEPVSRDFGLMIPKIGLNVPIISNVDGGNPSEYLWKVKQGVAHFKHRQFANVVVDGSFPGEVGNIFLFGHSQVIGGDMSDYKGVFNDLYQLNEGDLIIVFYQGDRFLYSVIEGCVISKNNLTVLEATEEETLSLMTCWPLGLDIQRYLVKALRVEEDRLE